MHRKITLVAEGALEKGEVFKCQWCEFLYTSLCVCTFMTYACVFMCAYLMYIFTVVAAVTKYCFRWSTY